jgi:uncharacterized membrane protein YraQ (UPF0718 family)
VTQRAKLPTLAVLPAPATAPVTPGRPAVLHGGRLVPLLALGLIVWATLYAVLRPGAGFLTHRVLGLPAGTPLGESVAFFLYDAPKVLLLLVLVVFAIGVVRTFFTPERSRALLAGRRAAAGNVAAAGLGVVTPFCSCSAVPLFLGFVEAGIPLGVTLSFLIAAPMVNEVALVLLFGLFGWRIALLYLTAGLAIAIVAGWVLGRLRLERHVEPWVYDLGPGVAAAVDVPAPSWSERVARGVEAVREIAGRVWPYVVAGIAVGATIHGYVPDGMLAAIVGESAWWSVPLAVVMGVPLYANAAGIVPVVQALLEKGVALGTALAFMMAVIGLSLPEAIILRKVLRPPLIAAFIGVVAAGILVVGYLFNMVM